MAHIHKSILIHAPVEKVYEVARDPRNWNTFFVGLSEPEKIDGKGETGTVVKQHYMIAGMSFPVTSRVVEDKLEPKEAHWKGEIEGPLAGKQEWVYTTKGKDTEVVSDVEYTVPGQAIGKLADRLIIERMQERSAEQTLENLKLLCEARA